MKICHFKVGLIPVWLQKWKYTLKVTFTFTYKKYNKYTSFLQVKGIYFFLKRAWKALHPWSADGRCNVGLLHTHHTAYSSFACTGCHCRAVDSINELWVCRSMCLQFIQATSMSVVVAGTCSFIHRKLWMNDVAVWAEPCTAMLLSKSDSGCREKNIRLLQWGGGGR